MQQKLADAPGFAGVFQSNGIFLEGEPGPDEVPGGAVRKDVRMLNINAK
jgi:hypothetical protein